MLDKHDNLATSMKYITDAIASLLVKDKASGRADDDPRLSFRYSQRKPLKNESRGIEVTIEET